MWYVIVISILPKRNYSSSLRPIKRREKAVANYTDADNDATDGRTRIKQLDKVEKKLNSPTLIAGFPGAGLVGSISTSYIIDKLHMNQISCIE
jgi:hypothetical protein